MMSMPHTVQGNIASSSGGNIGHVPLPQGVPLEIPSRGINLRGVRNPRAP